MPDRLAEVLAARLASHRVVVLSDVDHAQGLRSIRPDWRWMDARNAAGWSEPAVADPVVVCDLSVPHGVGGPAPEVLEGVLSAAGRATARVLVATKDRSLVRGVYDWARTKVTEVSARTAARYVDDLATFAVRAACGFDEVIAIRLAARLDELLPDWRSVWHIYLRELQLFLIIDHPILREVELDLAKGSREHLRLRRDVAASNLAAVINREWAIRQFKDNWRASVTWKEGDAEKADEELDDYVDVRLATSLRFWAQRSPRWVPRSWVEESPWNTEAWRRPTNLGTVSRFRSPLHGWLAAELLNERIEEERAQRQRRGDELRPRHGRGDVRWADDAKRLARHALTDLALAVGTPRSEWKSALDDGAVDADAAIVLLADHEIDGIGLSNDVLADLLVAFALSPPEAPVESELPDSPIVDVRPGPGNVDRFVAALWRVMRREDVKEFVSKVSGRSGTASLEREFEDCFWRLNWAQDVAAKLGSFVDLEKIELVADQLDCELDEMVRVKDDVANRWLVSLCEWAGFDRRSEPSELEQSDAKLAHMAREADEHLQKGIDAHKAADLFRAWCGTLESILVDLVDLYLSLLPWFRSRIGRKRRNIEPTLAPLIGWLACLYKHGRLAGGQGASTKAILDRPIILTAAADDERVSGRLGGRSVDEVAVHVKRGEAELANLRGRLNRGNPLSAIEVWLSVVRFVRPLQMHHDFPGGFTPDLARNVAELGLAAFQAVGQDKSFRELLPRKVWVREVAETRRGWRVVFYDGTMEYRLVEAGRRPSVHVGERLFCPSFSAHFQYVLSGHLISEREMRDSSVGRV